VAPEPNTVEALLADAQTAMARGDASRAVRLLEEAFDKDSTDVRVRMELGNALYAERGLDLFLLRSAAEHLAGTSGSSSPAVGARSSPGAPSSRASVCTDAAQPESDAERYDPVPNEAEPLRQLGERTAVVDRVRRLVVAGVLERRPEALSSAPSSYRQKGLLLGAVTAVAADVIDVHVAIDSTGGSLYLDRGASPHRALVACADTGTALDRVHDALCALETAARRAVEWLQARTPAPESSQDAVLIERLQDLAYAAGARIDCS
jgi:hypothetical protein